MLEKDPKQRLQLIEFMEMEYYQIEEEELEEKIKTLKEEIELKKQQKGD